MDSFTFCTIRVESTIPKIFPESCTFEAQIKKITNELEKKEGIIKVENISKITDTDIVFCITLKNITSEEQVTHLLTGNQATFNLLEVSQVQRLAETYSPPGYDETGLKK